MLLHDLGMRLIERLRLHRDIRRLESLDDRLLADAGVRRRDIAAMVRGEA